jgi:O-antigen ligase
LAHDDSANYRERELTNLEIAVSKAPVLGHGFGFAYQPPQGKAGTFWGDRAPYYSHNFYWWTLAKTGIIGLGLALFAMLAPLAGALTQRYSGPQVAAAAASLAGLLAVSWVAPLPIDSPTSLLIGAALGAALGWGGLRGGDGATPGPRGGISDDALQGAVK